MIGALDPTRKDATVVGGGIAGLLAAHFLDRAGFEVTLLEARDRAGGLLETLATPYGPAERAAHTLMANQPTIDLCRDLGVRLHALRPDSRAKYIWREGRMRKFPLTGPELMATIARATTVSADGASNRTIESWARRHLGEAALQYLFNPMLRGIYAARPSEISVEAAFPRLVVGEGRSLIRQLVISRARDRAAGKPRAGRPVIAAPEGGMGAWAEALAARVREKLGARYRLGERVERLPDAGNVVICAPAGQASRLLAGSEPGLSRALAAVSYTPMVSVTAFARRADFARGEPRGLGVLVPECEARECLGILFNSSCFDGKVTDPALASFTVMIGADATGALPGTSGTLPGTTGALPDDSRARGIVEREMTAILGLRGAPVHQEITRWERAIPKYSPELLETWRVARETWCSRPGRVLFGNYTGQVSLRGMVELASTRLGSFPVVARA